MIRLADPDIDESEVAAVRKVLLSGVLTNGPQLQEFEEAFAAYHGVKYGVGFANGTLALTAILIGLGIGPGDEVIVPSMSFVSTATAVLHAGATPVFAEVDPLRLNIDAWDARERITAQTRAIIAVHYGGCPADLDELVQIAASSGLHLIEDAAEAHGAVYRGRRVGGFGRAGMFSFTPTKNITTGEGGMVTTNDSDLAGHLRLLRNHGQTGLYQHDLVGFNWRMSELQAAVGVVQLTKLERILHRKKSNAQWMQQRLSGAAGLELPSVGADREHVYMLYTVKLEDRRDAVLSHLLEMGVEARVYFPPIHMQPIFAGRQIRLPVTENLSRRILSLPFHSKLTEVELEVVAGTLLDAIEQTKR